VHFVIEGLIVADPPVAHCLQLMFP
jgi:hypothetical protein